MKERYRVTGMTCSACSSHVEKAVGRLDGVEKASVNLLTGTMEVSYDEGRLGEPEIIAAVEKSGYGAEVLCTRNAGTCGTDAGGGSKSQRGGTGSGSDPRAGRGGLQRKAEEEADAMRRRLVVSIGFLIPLMYVAMYHMYHEWFGLPIPGFVQELFHGNENAMTFAMTQFLLLLPILYENRKYFSVGFRTLRHLSPNMDSLIALGASAAVGYGIFATYRIGYGLGHGDAALVQQYAGDLYFESAGMILTLITVGKYLESRSKGRTSEAITKLMDLSPKVAVVVDEDGGEREVPTEELQAGTVFLVKPGSLVPVDGTVLEGSSSVDEAAITGESIPVEKQAGDKVVSATMNKTGFLKCRADRVGEDTTLSQIIRLVEEAGASKAPIARLADEVAGVFVPVVICIALITLAAWLAAGAGPEFAISSAIAVLVISCPCALGLATPVAIMVGTGVGANHGILIKSGEALQQARDIDTVVLDKTGTVTTGKLHVTGTGCYVQDVSLETMVGIAAALEKKSEHPLAEAVLAYAEREGLELPEMKDFKAVVGRGVEGVLAEDVAPRISLPWQKEDGPTAVFLAGKREDGSRVVATETLHGGEQDVGAVFRELAEKLGEDVGAPIGRVEETSGKTYGAASLTDAGAKAGTRYLVGNRAYVEENGIVIDPVVLQGLEEIAGEGMTPLLVAEEGRLLGEISVADRVKGSSAVAIRRFQKMGIHVVLLTGDNRRTAEAVRRQLGIEEAVAEVLPQDKERKVSELRAAGRKVAMIGDGINDAPALAAADVGMAIGAGTDVAMESADIVLMKSDLRDAVTAISLSKAVIRNIKQNLFWAFFYNAIGIPLAAGAWYPLFQIRLSPMFGAAAMSLSSIFVVGNALRLRGFRSGFERKGRSRGERVAGAAEEAENAAGKPDQAGAIRKEDRFREQEEREEEKMTKTLTIEGMMCGHCTGRVQKALEALEGVSSVTMALEAKTATVELSGEVSDEMLTKAVDEAGYQVTSIK